MCKIAQRTRSGDVGTAVSAPGIAGRGCEDDVETARFDHAHKTLLNRQIVTIQVWIHKNVKEDGGYFDFHAEFRAKVLEPRLQTLWHVPWPARPAEKQQNLHDHRHSRAGRWQDSQIGGKSRKSMQGTLRIHIKRWVVVNLGSPLPAFPFILRRVRIERAGCPIMGLVAAEAEVGEWAVASVHPER